ncbi:hypothetical protein SY88_07460 [Clostridiales bacterium PH28_bin88]|nr:hypothetical protein SY88_07460 [Clostridiales bacterium PH28_bin88]
MAYRVCISDADVLINLIKAECIEILRLMFEEVVIPEKIREEVSQKTKGQDFNRAIQAGWIRVVSFKDLSPVQKAAIEIFNTSYRDALDDGERHAAALANELGIRILLSNDKGARRIIEHNTGIHVMSHWEYLVWCVSEDKLSVDEGESYYKAVEAILDRPVGSEFKTLMKRAKDVIDEVKRITTAS